MMFNQISNKLFVKQYLRLALGLSTLLFF